MSLNEYHLVLYLFQKHTQRDYPFDIISIHVSEVFPIAISYSLLLLLQKLTSLFNWVIGVSIFYHKRILVIKFASFIDFAFRRIIKLISWSCVNFNHDHLDRDKNERDDLSVINQFFLTIYWVYILLLSKTIAFLT